MCHKAKMKDVDLATADAGEPRLCHVARIDDMRMPAISKCAGVKDCGNAGKRHVVEAGPRTQGEVVKVNEQIGWASDAVT